MRISDWSSDVCSSDLGAEWPHGRLIDRRRHLFRMPRHQQEAFSFLGQAADLTAIMDRFPHDKTVVAEQRDDLIEEMPAARHDKRHVFEYEELGQIVFPRLKRQPDGTNGQPIDRKSTRLNSSH